MLVVVYSNNICQIILNIDWIRHVPSKKPFNRSGNRYHIHFTFLSLLTSNLNSDNSLLCIFWTLIFSPLSRKNNKNRSNITKMIRYFLYSLIQNTIMSIQTHGTFGTLCLWNEQVDQWPIKVSTTIRGSDAGSCPSGVFKPPSNSEKF